MADGFLLATLPLYHKTSHKLITNSKEIEIILSGFDFILQEMIDI
jgi:hypothetical protein